MLMRLTVVLLVASVGMAASAQDIKRVCGTAVLGNSVYARTDNPPCDGPLGNRSTCAATCVQLPTIAQFSDNEVETQLFEENGVTPARGWSGWSGPFTINDAPLTKNVCRIGKNWKHDRTRVAKICVTYRNSLSEPE